MAESDWFRVQDFPGAGIGNRDVSSKSDTAIVHVSIAQKLQAAQSYSTEVEFSCADCNHRIVEEKKQERQIKRRNYARKLGRKEQHCLAMADAHWSLIEEKIKFTRFFREGERRMGLYSLP